MAVDTLPTCPDCGFQHALPQSGQAQRLLVLLHLQAERINRVLEIHKSWGIYEECGHEHTEEELEDPASSVHQVDLVGLVCAEGLMYRVCRNCCVEPGWAEGYQLEACVAHHEHTVDGPVCPTAAAMMGVEMEGAERWT